MARQQARKMKSDGRYKDAPRYKAIYGYEDEYNKSFVEECLHPMTKELAHKLGEFAKAKKL